MGKKIYDAAIIGAGAAGLMAAIAAARAGARPVLLEHMEMPAKKLLATGNGKCNYTNADQALDHYFCEAPGFIQTVFAQFSYTDVIRFFDGLGIRPVQKNGTCIYPESEQAASVRNALLAEASRLRIPLILPIGIRKIEKEPANRQNSIFVISAKDQTIYSCHCILATGGKAAKKTGSDGSGYIYARQLGHTVIEPLPALTALQADFRKRKLPAGVRIHCKASLALDGDIVAAEQGELQITDYGLSGIVIFQFSRLASKALADRRKVRVLLDFKPDMPMESLADYLYGRFRGICHSEKTYLQCLDGFLPDKLIPAVLKQAGIAGEEQCHLCSGRQAASLAQALKSYGVAITGTKSFDFAQTTAGGIPVSEINARTMESRLVKGLYFAGEMIDVDAKCGGYNLQWAWASGYVAGKSAGASAGKSHENIQEADNDSYSAVKNAIETQHDRY